MSTNESSYLKKGLYYLTDLTLTNNSGSRSTRIDGFIKEMRIEESLFNSVITGKLSFKDGASFLNAFPVVGEETLSIGFKTQNSDSFAEFKKVFVIHNPSHIEPDPAASQAGFKYSLSMVSPELFADQSTKVQRGYTNTLISDMVKDVFESFLRVNKTIPLAVEPTATAQNFVTPSLTPFEAINVMSTFASSTTDPTHNLFMFFENRDGYNFVNLMTLYKQPSIYTYNVNTDSAFAINEQGFHPLSSPVRVNIKRGTDKLDALSSGMINNTVLGIDLISKQSVTNNFDYRADFATASHVDSPSFSLISSNFPWTSSQAFRTVNSRDLRLSSNYYRQKAGAQLNSKSYETFLPYRMSLLQQLKQLEIDITVGGNTNLTCGNLVTLQFPAAPGFDNSTDPNVQMYTGIYLIKKLIHIFKDGQYFMQLSLVRDCYSQDVNSI